ncbi:MAG: bifunctional 5,10-methylenetetrahydrofolate dehydrogenase/5,10-methenyltetrahydrofolate cyclohydrolase [Alphaproteobacteria bacterium]|nr:MAG: bifunctional 5,10-methylenetetrahydrofolate dehydrogenase/5,10-methenyltetrahydrofolate cyclohydrolase [Alphaproteobacteria bacterium]
MMHTLLDGITTAKQRRQDLTQNIRALRTKNIFPHLAVVRVGDDPASQAYVTIKQKICATVGIDTTLHELPKEASEDEIHTLIEALNNNPEVDGILLQLPLPGHLNARQCLNCIAPEKDVDGLTDIHAQNLAKGTPGVIPCTPLGCMNLLRAYNLSVRGQTVAIIGRSPLVGTPLRYLMEQAGATVNVIHTRTCNPHLIARHADILISAAGVPHLVTDFWVKNGAIVLDVGITRHNNRLVGDVDFEKVAPKTSYITPVPGGIGPMTVQSLLENTLKLSKMRNN